MTLGYRPRLATPSHYDTVQVTKPVDPEVYQHLPEVLASLGLQPLDHDFGVPPSACYTVSLDGRVVGRVPHASAARFVDKLRTLKIQGEKVCLMNGNYCFHYYVSS
jgi:hypothetical protein